MKPAPFDYVRADSVEHAVTQLGEANVDGEGKIIAGGQSLMPLLALRLAQPSVLIDINRVPGLAEISPLPGGGLRIGALIRHRTLAAQGKHPLLAEAARWIGHAAIRTRGTLGGSLAHADPAAELPVAAAAAGAVALVTGPGGQRRIAAGDLFTGALQTCLDDDELIEAVELPAPSRWGFAEFARDGELHPLQQAFADCHGLQCGFCTPGFLISALHLLAENPDPSREDIRAGLSGNICRCTGYAGIVDAVRQAAAHG